MELDRTNKWFYFLTSFAVIFILALGGWWLYLFFKLANKLEEYDLAATEGNLVLMLQWEGVTFFILLISLGCALFYVFFQDHKKTRSLQAFFSSLTHELKTPLASIRLQSQVLNDFLENQDIDQDQKQQLRKYTERLQNDSIRLENELDRHLQLSRVEKNAPLNLKNTNLKSLIDSEVLRYSGLQFKIICNETNIDIEVDEFAFSMIIRNLIENTLKHSNSKNVDIEIAADDQLVSIVYNDHNQNFTGDLTQLGKLFYKHDSPKGSGLGLYLIKKLCKLMNGNFLITNDNSLLFTMSFPRNLE
jgi:signal transduction histidine kinase